MRTQTSPRARLAHFAQGEEQVLVVRDLRVSATVAGELRPLVRGIDLGLERGEALALVGESGSGKSMVARSLMQLLGPGLRAEGSIRLHGRELMGLRESELERIRGREIGMVFQDPFTMLSPTKRCGDQIVELLRDESGHRLRGDRRRREIAKRLAEVGIDDADVGRAYPGELSGGMRQRVGIAAALTRDPEILIADEPTTALDVTTQREILRLLRSLQHSRGMTLILITHDLRVAFSMCDRVAVMYAGAVVETGPTEEVATRPRHPYSRGLLDSEPPADQRLARIAGIAGTPTKAHEHLRDCAFAPRCSWSVAKCTSEPPPRVGTGPHAYAACWRTQELTLEQGPSSPAKFLPTTDPPGDETDTVVEVRGLTKTFGSSRRRVPALGGVSVTVGRGEAIGIVGESGSGKSTLARCIVGLETADRGTVIVDGTDVSNYRTLDRAVARRIRGVVQMIFQDPNSTLNPALTVGTTLAEACRAGGAGASRANVIALLEQVGMTSDHQGRRPHELSGGQRQRVAIARALAGRPDVLVCDEAVSALDVSVQAQVLNVLNDLRHRLGISLLFITHDLAVVRQVTDRVYVLRNGSVVEHGATTEVLDRPRAPYTKALMAAAPRLVLARTRPGPP